MLSGVGEHWIAARGVFDPRPVVSFLGPPEFELPPCVNLGVGEIVIEECVCQLCWSHLRHMCAGRPQRKGSLFTKCQEQKLQTNEIGIFVQGTKYQRICARIKQVMRYCKFVFYLVSKHFTIMLPSSIDLEYPSFFVLLLKYHFPTESPVSKLSMGLPVPPVWLHR